MDHDPDAVLDALARGLSPERTAARFHLPVADVRKLLKDEVERCLNGEHMRAEWALADRRLAAMEIKFFERAMEGDGDTAAAMIAVKTNERRATLAGANMPQSHVLHLASQPAPTMNSTERIRAAIDRIRAMPKPMPTNGEDATPKA